MAPPLILTPAKTGDLTRALKVTYGRARKRVNSWAYRVLGGLDVATTDTQIAWPEMTIQEFDRGPMGDDITYQTIKWVDRLVSVESKGVAFRMRTYQDNDLQRANAIRSVGVFGDQCGFKAATYDMRGVKYTLQNGENEALVTARKGGALFRRGHPVGGGSSDTFDNLFTGLAFNALNLGAIVSYISQIDDGTGEPEDAEPTVFTLLPNNYKMRSDQMSDAEILKDAFGTNNAASNTFYKGPYGFDEPIVSAHMGNEPDVWHVFVDWGDMPEEAPLNRMELEGWNLQEFSPRSELDLAKSESFEVHHKARIGFAGGNPKKAFRIKASGSASDNAQKFKDILANM